MMFPIKIDCFPYLGRAVGIYAGMRFMGLIYAMKIYQKSMGN